MFLENKYSRIYWRLVERGKCRILPKEDYSETHHIIPKSLGGTNSMHNLVQLTAREHYILHLCLVKMVTTPLNKRKMIFAFHKMRVSNSSHRSRYFSRSYELFKKAFSRDISGQNNPAFGKGLKGEKNPFFGRKHTPETIEVLRKKCGQPGTSNPFFGKTHSEKTRKMLRNKRSIPIFVEFMDGQSINFLNRLELGTHLGKSKSLGASLIRKDKWHLWDKYGIQKITIVEKTENENCIYKEDK